MTEDQGNRRGPWDARTDPAICKMDAWWSMGCNVGHISVLKW